MVAIIVTTWRSPAGLRRGRSLTICAGDVRAESVPEWQDDLDLARLDARQRRADRAHEGLATEARTDAGREIRVEWLEAEHHSSPVDQECSRSANKMTPMAIIATPDARATPRAIAGFVRMMARASSATAR
jgi:hypothetical protein